MADNERPSAAGADSGKPGDELDEKRAFAPRTGSVTTDAGGIHPDGTERGRSSAAMRGTQGTDPDTEPRAASSQPRSMPSQSHWPDSGPTGAERAVASDAGETSGAATRPGAPDLGDPTSR